MYGENIRLLIYNKERDSAKKKKNLQQRERERERLWPCLAVSGIREEKEKISLLRLYPKTHVQIYEYFLKV